jgi:hypothetical protein
MLLQIQRGKNDVTTEDTEIYSLCPLWLQKMFYCLIDIQAVLSIKIAEFAENMNCRRGGVSWEKLNVLTL